MAAVRARHLGNAGNVREARNLLATAEDFLGLDSDPAPSWAGFLTEPHIMRVFGRSYYSIGDLPKAAHRFERAAEGFGPDRGRGKAQVFTRLGWVYLAQGRTEEAQRQADRAAEAMTGVGSTRAETNLADLRQRLS